VGGAYMIKGRIHYTEALENDIEEKVFKKANGQF